MKLKDLIGVYGKTFIFVEDTKLDTCRVFKTMENSVYERILFFDMFGGERWAYQTEDKMMDRHIVLLVL